MRLKWQVLLTRCIDELQQRSLTVHFFYTRLSQNRSPPHTMGSDEAWHNWQQWNRRWWSLVIGNQVGWHTGISSLQDTYNFFYGYGGIWGLTARCWCRTSYPRTGSGCCCHKIRFRWKLRGWYDLHVWWNTNNEKEADTFFFSVLFLLFKMLGSALICIFGTKPNRTPPQRLLDPPSYFHRLWLIRSHHNSHQVQVLVQHHWRMKGSEPVIVMQCKHASKNQCRLVLEKLFCASCLNLKCSFSAKEVFL